MKPKALYQWESVFGTHVGLQTQFGILFSYWNKFSDQPCWSHFDRLHPSIFISFLHDMLHAKTTRYSFGLCIVVTFLDCRLVWPFSRGQQNKRPFLERCWEGRKDKAGGFWIYFSCLAHGPSPTSTAVSPVQRYNSQLWTLMGGTVLWALHVPLNAFERFSPFTNVVLHACSVLPNTVSSQHDRVMVRHCVIRSQFSAMSCLLSGDALHLMQWNNLYWNDLVETDTFRHSGGTLPRNNLGLEFGVYVSTRVPPQKQRQHFFFKLTSNFSSSCALKIHKMFCCCCFSLFGFSLSVKTLKSVSCFAQDCTRCFSTFIFTLFCFAAAFSTDPTIITPVSGIVCVRHCTLSLFFVLFVRTLNQSLLRVSLWRKFFVSFWLWTVICGTNKHKLFKCRFLWEYNLKIVNLSASGFFLCVTWWPATPPRWPSPKLLQYLCDCHPPRNWMCNGQERPWRLHAACKTSPISPKLTQSRCQWFLFSSVFDKLKETAFNL